ncbi:MAG: hypothetical protein VX278_08395 [Myxococcota bacterium]|nr:hypothetical protein [Myxococcota bacterium]
MMLFFLFLSCAEDKTYPSSSPTNCSAWFCSEDFTPGTVGGSTTDELDTSDTASPDDTAELTDTFGNPIDEDEDGDGDGDGSGESGSEDSGSEDTGFHKDSDDCGCADPGAGFSVILFTSMFGLWRRKRDTETSCRSKPYD